MRRLTAILALTFLWALPLHAQSQSHNYNGIGDAGSLTIIDDVAFEYDVQLNLGQMMREPVVGSRFRWRIDVPNSQATIPAMGIGENTYEAVPLAALGSEAPAKVRIHNVRIEYQLSTAVGTLYLLSDAGDPAPGDGQKWSFNVPGSPDWSRMFHRSPMQSVDESRSFVSAQTAQQAMGTRVQMTHARILGAEISFFDLHNWYMRNTDASQAIATERALEEMRIGVFRNFGYDVRGVNASFFPPSKALGSVRSGIGQVPSIMTDYLKRAGPRLEKLLDVPDDLRTNEDTSIYDDAVRAARASVDEARRRSAAYRSPDKDPRNFRQGNQAAFGGSYAVQGIDGEDWIVDTANNGAKVRKLESEERLIGTSYFINRSKVHAVCQNNVLAIPLLDPATMETVRTVDLPCQIDGSSNTDVTFSSPDDKEHPYFSVEIRQSPIRSVRKSYTCSACGVKTRHQQDLNQMDFSIYRIIADLSFTKVKDYTWTQATGGCGLTLCRK